jgi:hypothetical protein
VFLSLIFITADFFRFFSPIIDSDCVPTSGSGSTQGNSSVSSSIFGNNCPFSRQDLFDYRTARLNTPNAGRARKHPEVKAVKTPGAIPLAKAHKPDFLGLRKE